MHLLFIPSSCRVVSCRGFFMRAVYVKLCSHPFIHSSVHPSPSTAAQSTVARLQPVQCSAARGRAQISINLLLYVMPGCLRRYTVRIAVYAKPVVSTLTHLVNE